jgi:hypothetical protein
MPPDAQTVHPGHTAPPEGRRELICAWLEANGINPEDVVATRPVYVLAVPNGTIQGGIPWLIDVIVVHQFYRNADGYRERDFITGDAVMFQRTVPLKVPFPADPTTDDEGETDGEADRQAAQEAPEEVLRPSGKEGLSDPRQGTRPGGPLEGQTARDEGAAEEGSGCGDEAVPESEEERREDDQQPEEEVTK